MADINALSTLLAQDVTTANRIREEVRQEIQQFNNSILDHVAKHSGAGSYLSQFHNMLARIDRYGIRSATYNHVHRGLTFFTRPEINFSPMNLRMSRIFSMLDTLDPQTIQFMIRFLLDSKSARSPEYHNFVAASPWIDNDSPFITPLTNCLESLSGFPQSVIETYTSEPGLFSEDITMPIGSDRNYKSFDLSATFNDIQGGVIAALCQYWAMYTDMVNRGEMVQHTSDINEQIMGFTTSIYRFLLDPSQQYIVQWCCVKGCFPLLRSSGTIFDVNSGESFVEAAKKFNVTFKCNIMGNENDPIILKEFNMLVERFCPEIASENRIKLGTDPGDNYLGLPYIRPTQYGPKLEFYAKPGEDQDTYVEQRKQAEERISRIYGVYQQTQNTSVVNATPSQDFVYV